MVPTLSLSLFCAAISFFVAAVFRRRFRLAGLAAAASIISATIAWNLVDMWWVIPTGMLICCSLLGFMVGRRMSRGQLPDERAKLLVVALLGAGIPCFGFLFITIPFRMWDDVTSEVQSPDGAYTATLAYRDGLTFGFQHIMIRSNGWRLLGGSSDIVEVAESGLNKIFWSGNRTLVVEFDGSKHKDKLMDTCFVHRSNRWQDVQIEYRESRN